MYDKYCTRFLLTKINSDNENSFSRRSFQYFTLYFRSEKCFWMAQETWINGFDAHANSTLNSCFVSEYSMVFLCFVSLLCSEHIFYSYCKWIRCSWQRKKFNASKKNRTKCAIAILANKQFRLNEHHLRRTNMKIYNGKNHRLQKMLQKK